MGIIPAIMARIMAITVLVIIIITLPVFMDIMGTAFTITVDLDITGCKPMDLRVDCMGLTMEGAVGTGEAGLLMGAEASTTTRMADDLGRALIR